VNFHADHDFPVAGCALDQFAARYRHARSSDSEVRKISRRPLMRTSESKELWQLIISSAALNLKFL
jgi:hypothetical protein